MGWLSNIAKKITTTRFFPSVGISGVSTAKRLVTQPKREIKRAIKETAVGLSVAFPPARALTTKVAKSVFTSIIPKTLRGKVIAGTTGLIGYGILRESPKAREFTATQIKRVPEIPGGIVEFGGDVGGVIEGEKKFGPKDILSGVKKAGLVGGAIAGGIVGAAALPFVVGKVKGKKTAGGIQRDVPMGVPSETPILPETTSLTARKTSRRRRTAKKTPSVRQSVRVNVINKPKNIGISISNKKYLNQELLN